MMMMMACALRQRLVQRQKLTLKQKIHLESNLIRLNMDLVGRLRNEQYETQDTCPKCGSRLSLSDILKGFLNVPDDYTTICPTCKERFEPQIINWGRDSRMSLPFFCNMQTLARLRGLEHMDPDEFQKKQPAIYRSAIVHFGSLRAAFKAAGVEDYPHESIHNWETIVVPFLGRMTDVSIASAAGVSPASVGKLRAKHKIPRFLKSEFFE